MHYIHTYLECHLRAMINTESQCVTSAMQIIIAKSVVNAKITIVVRRESFFLTIATNQAAIAIRVLC